MAKDKRVFTGGMDKDSEPRLIKQGDYRHAENIRNIASSDGTSGSVENIEGNKEVIHPFISEEIVIAETIDNGFTILHEPEQIFYSQEIYISGRETIDGKYNFSLHGYDNLSNLIFSGINLSWEANDDFTGTASYLHARFNPNDGDLSSNIPLVNRQNGEIITGHSEIFIQSTNIPFTPSTSMVDGSTTLVIRIVADVEGIDFDLDFKSSYSPNPSLDLWVNTVTPEHVNGRFYVISNQALYLGSAAGFEESDTIASSESEDGSPIGLINTEESSDGTEILISFEGTLPSTPQDPIEELNIFSIAENSLTGETESLEFIPDKLNFSSAFNSGDPFEFTGDLNELSEALIDKFTNLEAEVLIPVSGGGVNSTILKTTNGNFVTGFDANTKLESRSRSTDYDFYVVKHFTTEADFIISDYNQIQSSSSISIEGNSLVLSENYVSDLFFPIDIIQGKQYRLDVNISTFNAAGVVLSFLIGESESNPISTTNSSFTFSFEGLTGGLSTGFLVLKISNPIPEGGSIVMQGISLSQHREPVSSLQILVKSPYNIDLVFAPDQQTAIDNSVNSRDQQRSSNFLDGVDVTITKLSQSSLSYNDLLDDINTQEVYIQELLSDIDSLQNQLNTLTEEYNNLIFTLNAAAALDSADAYGTLTQLNNDLSAISGNNDLLLDILSDVNNTIGNLNINLSENETTINDLNQNVNSLGLQVSDLTSILSNYQTENESLTSQISYLTNLNNDLQEEVGILQASLDNAESDELITNGDFSNSEPTSASTFEGWSVADTSVGSVLGIDVSIENNELSFNKRAGITSSAFALKDGDLAILESGKEYILSFDVMSSINTSNNQESTAILSYYNGSSPVSLGHLSSGVSISENFTAGGNLFFLRNLTDGVKINVDNVSIKEVSQEYLSLQNDLDNAVSAQANAENALFSINAMILESGLTLPELISGYNSATDELGNLVSSVQGMITTINGATFTNQELTDDLQNHIQDLETFIQAAVSAADALSANDTLTSISDYSNALGDLQNEYTNLVSFISNLNTDVSNILDENGNYSNILTNLNSTLHSLSASNLVNNINSLINSANEYSNSLNNLTDESNVTQDDLNQANENILNLESLLANAQDALEILQNAFPLTNLITYGDFTDNEDDSVYISTNWSIEQESIISQPTTTGISSFILKVNGDQTNGKYVLSFSLVHAHNVQVIIQKTNNLLIQGGGTFNAPLDTISESGFYTIEANLSDLEGSETIQVKFTSVNNYYDGGTIIDNISLVKVPDGVNVNSSVFSDFASQINELLLQVLTLDITTDNLDAIQEAAYNEGLQAGQAIGAAGVGEQVNAAYEAGADSVDITVDNQESYDLGFADGYSEAQDFSLFVIDDLFNQNVGYQLDIMNLLGLIQNLTGQTIDNLQGTVADAQLDIETIATTSAQDVLDATDEYEDLSGSIQSQINALIAAVGQLTTSSTTTQVAYDKYTFVVYGNFNSGSSLNNNLRLLLKNSDIPGYEEFDNDNYVVDLSSQQIYQYYSEIILNSCHEFGSGDLPHSTYNSSLSPHSHFKTITIPEKPPSVLRLTIENFNETTGLPGPDISSFDFEDNETPSNDLNNGLRFTVTVLSGPSGWEFGVPSDGVEPNEITNILSDSTNYWNIASLPEQPATDESVGPNNLLTGDTQPSISSSNSGGFSGAGNWSFDAGTPKFQNSGYNPGNNDNYSTNQVVDDDHFLTKTVTLEPNTVYEIEFVTWFHILSGGYPYRGLKVDLGPPTGSSEATSQTANSVISEDWGGANMMLRNDIQYFDTNYAGFSGGLGYSPAYPLKVRIKTGPQYTANIIRFSAAEKIQTAHSQPVTHGFTGYVKNVSIKKVNSATSNSPAVGINLLGEKTSSALEENRSSFLNTSRAYTGASRRIVKNPLKAAPQVVPIISLGYTCIGTYEDKPNNKLYYFVVNREGTKKYDCILEYDLMTNSIETVYQDDRPSSNFEENNILNFSASHLITGVDKVDDILYFTDNVNRPRKINVELAKQNERNIKNCKFIFKDFYYRSAISTVFIGVGSNNHPFKKDDNIYAQSANTTNQNLIGLNGYAKVIGIVRKPLDGVEFTVTDGSSTITASLLVHGLNNYVGDFIGIEDATGFPSYYKIQSIDGTTIQLEFNYSESGASSSSRKPVRFQNQNAVGIITDCPWPGASQAVGGKILYADPSSVVGEEKAYSPLISYGSYHEKSKYFDVIKHQPEHRPVVTPDRNSNFAANNILDNLFQFKYRYIHEDEEVTSYSAISDINIDPNFALNSAVNAEDYNSMANMLKVAYEDTISDVKIVEVVARKGNDGEFFLVDSIQNDFIKHLKRLKNELIPDSDFDYSDDNITSVIPFYNNGTYPFVDKSDSDKLFDAVPKLAKAQTILSNNRLAYGNVLEGYDNTKIVASSSFTFDSSTTLTSSAQDFPTSEESGVGGWTDIEGELFNNNLGGANGNTKHIQKWFLGNLSLASDRNQVVNINYSWSFVKISTLGGEINRDGNFNISMDATNIINLNFLGETLATHIENENGLLDMTGIGDAGGIIDSSSYDSSSKLLTVTFKYIDENPTNLMSMIGFGTGNFNDTNKSKFISGDVGLSSFKSGAFHNFGIAYFDETNRCSFVNAGPNYNIKIDDSEINGTRPYNKFYTENNGPALSTNSKVEFKIFNKPPVWATNYQMYYTGNTTVDEFIQMTVVNVIAGTNNDKQMYLSLQSLKGENWSYNESNNSQLEYNFVKGDRVRFISFDSGSGRQKFTEYIDLEIAGDDLYDVSDSDAPIGTPTALTSGFYIRINDPEKTAVTHSGGGTVSIAHTGFSLDGSGYENLIVEIYRPKKTLPEESMVYYEIGDKKPIINAGKSNRSHSGNSSQISDYSLNSDINIEVSSKPAIVVIESGDVYIKPRTMATDENGSPTETFFPEDYYLNDFHQTNHYNIGRINVINTNANERRLEASVYYSETYSSTSSINGLSSFNLANIPYYDYNKDFGSIQSLKTKDTDLIIFHENKVGRVLVGKDILNTASGEALVSLSTNVIDNYVTLYAGEYGCCIQPESIVKFNNKFYFVDIKRGAVLRLSADGLTIISDNGMRDYFRDIGEIYVINDPEGQKGSTFKIVAGYDAKYDEYIVTFPDIFESRGRWSDETVLWDSYKDKFQNKQSKKIYDAKTIAFNERINRWTSFYTFYPEFYGSVGRQFIGFKEGRLFKHNVTDRYYTDLIIQYPSFIQPKYNNLYDNQYTSEIQFPFNAEPSSVKTYNSITLEGDSKWFTSMYTNIGQTASGPEGFQNSYNEVVSTEIGYRRVKGTISNYEDNSGQESILKGNDTKFFSDLKKGDLVKIWGYDFNSGVYQYVIRIVKSIISNTIISIDNWVSITCIKNHMEVLDYKTKEGIHYASIPFAESFQSIDKNETSYTLSNENYGDGSEFFGVGQAVPESSVFNPNSFTASYQGEFNPVQIKKVITPNNMIAGAEYVLFSTTSEGESSYFSISQSSFGNYENNLGEVFICQRPTSVYAGSVLPTDYKLYIQRTSDNSTLFLGYPYSISNSRISFVKSSSYNISTFDLSTYGFLFIVKDGKVEGEKIKGSYMMATLSTDKDIPYKSKYKHNLYGASVDVDKSELSDK